jgi:tetratricopeptide (TPR) repeat protein
MRTAYELSLRSPRKRHSAAPGDASPGSPLALVRSDQQSGEVIAEEGETSPFRGDNEAPVGCGVQGYTMSSPLHWKNLGTALQAGGRYGEARSAFREARRLAPQDVDIALGMANLEMECGRYQRAYDMFRIVLDRSPQRVEVRIRAARACHELSKQKRTRLLLEGWQDWTLDDDTAAELAALLVQIGKVQDGLSLLKRIFDLSRVNTCTLACLASSLAHAGRLKKARHCLTLLPDPEEIHGPTVREEVLTACAALALREGNLPGARRFLEFLEMSAAPGTCRCAKSYFMLAEICFHMFDMDAAKKALLTGQSIRNKAIDIASPLTIELSRYAEEGPSLGGPKASASLTPLSMIS